MAADTPGFAQTDEIGVPFCDTCLVFVDGQLAESLPKPFAPSVAAYWLFLSMRLALVLIQLALTRQCTSFFHVTELCS